MSCQRLPACPAEGRCSGESLGSGNVVIRGAEVAYQFPGTLGDLAGSSTLVFLSSGSLCQDAVRKCLGCGIHYLSGRDQKSCCSGGIRPDLVLGRTSHSSSLYILLHVHSWYGKLASRLSQASAAESGRMGPSPRGVCRDLSVVVDARCGSHSIQI